MAAPTQQYPPWLTPVPNTIFGPGGVPITTSTTILYLPLTYYGPSIPLGAEWTYGGLTPPASTVVVSTTVIPSSSTPTATPSSTATASIPPASSASSFTSPSSTTTSSATPTKHDLLSHNQLIGIIVGAVIGALVIILALFVCFLLIKNRRRERHAASRRNVLSIDQDYVVVDDAHVPGDGSPRHSGEERDSLLQPHTGGPSPIMEPRYQRTFERGISPAQPVPGPSSQPMQQIPVEMGARPVAPRVPILPPDTHSSLNSGTSNSSTEMSSLGSLVPNSRLSTLSPLFEEQREIRRAVLASHLRGPILTPQAQRRMGELPRPESSGKDNDEDSSGLSSLPPPPRSMDPLPGLTPRGSSGTTHVRTAFVPYVQRNIKTHDSYGSSNRSSSQTDPEDAALLTARRVKPVDWGVRASPYYLAPGSDRPNTSSSASGGIISSISSRLSWFKNLDALPGSLNRRSGAQKSSSSSDKDPEASKALLSPIASESSEPQSPSSYDPVQRTAPESSQSDVRPRPFLGGLLSDGTRPMSGVSGRSGASSGAPTAYYDAPSSFPNTPTLAPLPRAMTPAPGSLGSQQSRESNNWRLPSPLAFGISSSSLHMNSEQAEQEALQALAEFGGRSNDAFLAYNENDTVTREHARELASAADVDALDMPVPPGLPNFRHTFGVVPMSAFASTSTALSNANTITSTVPPTLFTPREGTLSTSTSESSLREASNETARAESSTLRDGSKQESSGAKTVSNMVHVPPFDADIFAVKEAKSWSNRSAGNDSLLGTIPSYHETIAPSRETSRTNMTGTTLATIGEDSTNTAISIDLLEDEPPSPGEGWRSLAGVIGGGSAAGAWEGVNRRFTMGTPMPDRYVRQDALAELGSLQSMRSHLSPASSHRSSGSAPASRRDISGSSGSRSSARYSLAHSGSISSFEGRRRNMSSLRYQAYSGSNNSGGSVSPTLSAFGIRIRRQASDDGTPMLRNLSPLSEQQAMESGSLYYTPPESMSGRSTNGTQDMSSTFRSAMTVQTTGSAETPLMEVEEDVVDAARAAMSSNYDREFGLRSPRSRTNESEASLRLSNAPWAAGLDQSWTPL